MYMIKSFDIVVGMFCRYHFCFLSWGRLVCWSSGFSPSELWNLLSWYHISEYQYTGTLLTYLYNIYTVQKEFCFI